jgi:hypothetical protein
MGEKLHWFMVATVSDLARASIEEIGGIVYPIDEPFFPLLTVVGLPYPTFEAQEFYAYRIRAGGKSFIWKGSHPGPEWTNAGDTTLRCEYGEPSLSEPVPPEALDLGDF